MDIHSDNYDRQDVTFRGVAASGGIAIGDVFILNSRESAYVQPPLTRIAPETVDSELARLAEAVSAAKQEIIALKEHAEVAVSSKDAMIFDTYMMIIDDLSLMQQISTLISTELLDAPSAFYQVINRYIDTLSSVQDQYIRERAADIKDVAVRVLNHLLNVSEQTTREINNPSVIIARDLAPSDTMMFDRKNVLAFATERGSTTSHTAILSRSMQIPSVVGVEGGLFEFLKESDHIIVDGDAGIVIVNPSIATLKRYREKNKSDKKIITALTRESILRPETLDGFLIQLAANIESIEDIESAKRFGAAGVGLFRTEYLYLNTEVPPSEESQLASYTKLLQGMDGDPVIIRTLDLGGDKLDFAMRHFAEANPFLGLRGLRFCLHDRLDIFKTQLRALFRAGVHGKLKIMVPMVSCLDEIIETKSVIRSVMDDLTNEGLDFNPNIKFGVMIETPAAALLADRLAKEVDFFSIGTNDLIQYSMAIDRCNERVAYLNQPTNPIILEQIYRCVRAARHSNIWVSVCGQMASNPKYVPLLLGLGVHELSMSPISIGPIRRIIRQLKMYEAEKAAKAAMAASTAQEALDISLQLLRRIADRRIQ